MNIIIPMFHDISENTPRSFRVLELAKELKRRGNQVTIICVRTKKIIGPEENLSKFEQIESKEKVRNKKRSRFVDFIRFWGKYFLSFPGIIQRTNYLISQLKNYLDFDVVISISLPFFIHIAVAKTKFSSKTVKIFDCGDPFYYNTTKLAPYWKFIAKNTYKKADYVCVPTENALPTYYKLVDKEKMRVIPQGIDFSEYQLSEYKKNKIPTFVYAGIFYKDLRNPIPFLDYLTSLEKDFCFKIYTSTKQEMYPVLLEYQKKLNGKMQLFSMVSRKECIQILSQADFIINFENLVQKQVPSKLMDYGLSKRPVLSFSSKTFNKEVFNQFLEGDYSSKLDIDISKYDIKKVTDQFEELFTKEAK